MKRSVALIMAGVGAAGTLVAAFALPWARYGDLELGLARFPMWGMYAVAVTALHVFVAWHLAADSERRLPLRPVALICAAATVLSAGVVMLSYDDPSAFFDVTSPTRAVAPQLGIGGPMAIVSALVVYAAVTWAPARDKAVRRGAASCRTHPVAP